VVYFGAFGAWGVSQVCRGVRLVSDVVDSCSAAVVAGLFGR